MRATSRRALVPLMVPPASSELPVQPTLCPWGGTWRGVPTCPWDLASELPWAAEGVSSAWSPAGTEGCGALCGGAGQRLCVRGISGSRGLQPGVAGSGVGLELWVPLGQV